MTSPIGGGKRRGDAGRSLPVWSQIVNSFARSMPPRSLPEAALKRAFCRRSAWAQAFSAGGVVSWEDKKGRPKAALKVQSRRRDAIADPRR